MNRVLLLLLGIAAWAGVALTAVLITFNIGEKNQILMFLPILAAVVVAWGVGEVVTERVFNRDEGDM
jgi:high-affinity Fe2+/Pb2+ permease